MKVSFEAHEFYAPDVCYHKSCYIKFALKKFSSLPEKDLDLLQENILDEYFLQIKKRIIYWHEAFLLSDLLEDMKVLCEENNLDEPVINNTRTLKRKIIERFP